MLVGLVVPALTAVYLVYPTHGALPTGAFQVDRFAYWKSVVVAGAGGLAALLLLFRDARQRVRALGRPVLLAAGVFLLSVWASSFLAQDVGRALFGAPHHREGAVVLTAYLALFLLASTASRMESGRLVVVSCLVGAGVVVPFGMAEFFESGKILSTLGHGNYLGAYLAILLPVATERALRAAGATRILCFLLAVLMVGALYGSQARGGILAALVGLGFLGWRLKREARTLWRRGLALLIAGGAVVAGMRPFADRELETKTEMGIVELAGAGEAPPWEAFEVKRTDARLSFRGTVLRIYRTEADVIFTRDDGFPLTTVADGENRRFTDPAYAAFRIEPRTSEVGRLIVVSVGKYSLPFRVEPAPFGFIPLGTSVTTETPALAFGTTKWDRLLSGRGYIWNRALPFVAKRWAIGAGPGAFADEFPHRDFLGKLNVYEEARTYVDRPHDLYLQLTHAGGLATLFAAFILWTLAFRRANQSSPALAAAIVAFAVSGLVNDSVVGVSAVFWIFAGLSAGAHAGDETDLGLRHA